MPRFILVFFVLWLIAAAVALTQDGFLVNRCLENHSIDTCYSAIGG